MALNAALLGYGAVRLRHRVLFRVRAWRDIPFETGTQYAELAQQRFTGWTPARVALVGDSQFELAPVGDLFGERIRNRGLKGATVADALHWIDAVLADRPEHVVVFLGTNDAYYRFPMSSTQAALETLFARLGAAGCRVSVVSVPPLPGRDAAVAAVNAELCRLTEQYGFGYVDLHAALAGTRWTDDGVHLDRGAYAVLGELLRERVG